MSMGFSMSFGMSLRQEQRLEQKITVPFDTAGDVDLLSLHRIRTRIPSMTFGPGVHKTAPRDMLSRNLMEENARYRREQNHKRYCITPNGLNTAIDNTRKVYERVIGKNFDSIDDSDLGGLVSFEGAGNVDRLRTEFLAKPAADKRKILTDLAMGPTDERIIGVMKQWFVDNYDELIYDTNGNIPYGVVLALRKRLGKWAAGLQTDFTEPMTDIIEEVIREAGKDPDSYSSHEAMWESLGGKLRKVKEEDED